MCVCKMWRNCMTKIEDNLFMRLSQNQRLEFLKMVIGSSIPQGTGK